MDAAMCWLVGMICYINRVLGTVVAIYFAPVPLPTSDH
jgi:hypothetical protein